MAEIPECDFKKIEEKWVGKFAASKKSDSPDKFYLLEMFPYPSGALHMGHMRNYSIGDTYKRFLEMKEKSVIYPMGYDAFGLPAENAAIKSGIHPKKWTMKNIEKMMSQQKKMGLSYQWDRLVITCEKEYYKWNQWFFLKMYERGIAYKKDAPINWCPGCQTVLANEQVVAGKCWRCNSTVEIKHLKQWFFKITAYAEELLADLEKLDWPEKVKIQQRNWIGKSEGVRIKFSVEGERVLEVFTTRPDTLWGATYMAISPHHPEIGNLAGSKIGEVEKLRRLAVSQNPEEKEKFGVELDKKAVNPATGEKIPIYAANFVLMEYGTGAIMCVPAHDKRDFEFAKKYKIPIRVVINPPGKNLDEKKMENAYTEEGILKNSGNFSGMPSGKAKREIARFLEQKGTGKTEINWHLRDWLVSRQRYWGTPIPIVNCPRCGLVAVNERNLPVELPENVKFTGKGNPLAEAEEFVNTKCPKCGGPAKRETDTLDTFVDSSWYFLRYLDSKNDSAPFSSEIANRLMPVDQYIGGIEHATMHLIYARFFTKVLRDLGLVKTDEPFKKLLCQGMVLKDGAKMSKSLGNVVSVNEILDKFGADTARLFILFAAPPERDLEWNAESVRGCHRFLKKIWNLAHHAFSTQPVAGISEEEKKELHFVTAKTIRNVENDLARFEFNTAISAIQEFTNFIQGLFGKHGNFDGFREAMKTAIKLLYPAAPFITSELSEKFSISLKTFPEYRKEVLESHEKEIIIQVNGKLRGKLKIKPGTSEDEVFRKAIEIETVRKFAGEKIRKKIYVPNKILNIVTGG
ncbi:MAG: leucine--tRNA ligase [Elusimicrobia bacterium]|nr:leucine--tRNA ligase [Elusimicrobiota bacterium]